MLQLANSVKLPGNLSQRMTYGIGGAAVLLVLVVVIFAVITSRQGVMLFGKSLDPDQLGEVEQQLSAWNVAYSATPDNVKVDPVRRNDILMRLSLGHIPHDHIATRDEELKTVGAMTPDTVIQAQQRAGLEGDLAIGIRSLNGVANAQVIIAPAIPGTFVTDAAHEASASVRVSMIDGVTLSNDQVAGMKSYVANAVPGLESNRVTVIDSNGVALQTGANRSGPTAQELQKTIQTALDQAIGIGQTIVLVHQETDPRSIEQRSLDRSPNGSAITGTSASETYKLNGKTYHKSKDSFDRGSHVVEQIAKTEPGRAERLSIAVMVDAQRADEMEHIKGIVAAASGLDVKRGDLLTVATMPFSHTSAVPAPLRNVSMLNVGPALNWIIVVLGIAGVLIVLIEPITALAQSIGAKSAVAQVQKMAGEAQAPGAEYSPAALHAMLVHEPMHTAAAIVSGLPTAVAAAVLEMYPAEERREIVRRLTRPVPTIVREVQADNTRQMSNG